MLNNYKILLLIRYFVFLVMSNSVKQIVSSKLIKIV